MHSRSLEEAFAGKEGACRASKTTNLYLQERLLRVDQCEWLLPVSEAESQVEDAP